jgi:hypothetical protein
MSQIQTRKYGRDWALDSVLAARVRRSVKYEDIYLECSEWQVPT